jgi:hypothetical protein
VDETRNLTAGAGLTGGGDLSADRTFDVVANVDGSIVVNVDDIQVGILATDAQHGDRGNGSLHTAFTDVLAGFAPASGGGTANFLRADGTWVAPPLAVPGGADNDVQFNNAGTFAGSSNFTWNDDTLQITTATAATPALKLQLNSTGERVGLEMDAVNLNEYVALRLLGSAFGTQRWDLKYQYVDDSLRFEIETGAIRVQIGRDTIALGGSYNDPNNAPFTIGESGYGQVGIGDVAISTTLFMEGLPFDIGITPVTAGRFWVKSDTPPTPQFTTSAGGDNQLAFVNDVVPQTRNLTAGAGLTGGGDLSADRTFDVVANVDGSIVVNADDIQVGVINDTQHGSRGGGLLHSVFTDALAGFVPASGGGTTNFLRADGTFADPVGSMVFGAEYQTGVSDALQTTTLNTYQTAYTFTSTSLPAGTYLFLWSYDAGSMQDKEASHRVLIDGTEVSEAEWRIKEGVDKTGEAWLAQAGQNVLTFGAAGTHTVTFQYKSNDDAYIRRMRVTLFRVA